MDSLCFEAFPGDYKHLFELFKQCCDDPLIEIAIRPKDATEYGFEGDDSIGFYGVVEYFHCFACGSFFG